MRWITLGGQQCFRIPISLLWCRKGERPGISRLASSAASSTPPTAMSIYLQ